MFERSIIIQKGWMALKFPSIELMNRKYKHGNRSKYFDSKSQTAFPLPIKTSNSN
jgi:hypothetical protein